MIHCTETIASRDLAGPGPQADRDRDMPTHGIPSSPRYPAALVDLLHARCHLRPRQAGAVVCNGSLRLAELFLRQGGPVTLVEADPAMRPVIVDLARPFAGARVMQGTPWATGLSGRSVDFIASDRVLFSPQQAAIREEFARILRPGAPVALITDNRVYGGGRQAEQYEQILRTHGNGFREKAQSADITGSVAAFFAGGEVYEDAFIGEQVLTLDELLTQAASLPIYPPPGDWHRAPIESALRKFFRHWSIEGAVIIPTVCRVAFGHLPG